MAKRHKATKSGFVKDPLKMLKAGAGFVLADAPTDAAPGFTGKKRDGQLLLAERTKALGVLQEQLFAQGQYSGVNSVLLILQAMDTAGKGGIVSHVVGSVDPQGVQLKAFKTPTPAEKRHDFLWRIEKEAPKPGMIGVFDRSHYEDVLIHRVHHWATTDELDRRYKAINDFESKLTDSGTHVIKIMLNITPEIQKERLAARLQDPTKYWKYRESDLAERAFWQEYMDAYQVAIERTSTTLAPWFVVPAGKKWYARLAVQEILLATLAGLKLTWPDGDFNLDEERRKVAEA
ncbi:PPK2 family polyphosphate kinase [Arthrobacter sp. H14-L1]|uniref:PPK2 family polyphosphate kinase n=1 Tax=Arthrobacter sp. H14-L1 TaxID=2996697 RepID=UPI00226FAE5E|nr:PPK2 family polyphosphate kinase [Arthrobacter sp. H14-L1]MCY0903417.1 polyphosphate kinase 2 family protein [Arthrobacter sp. H14-L1]